LPVEVRRVISDQISAIRRQEKHYAEDTESTEVAEKRRGTEASDRKNPPFPPEAGEGWGTLKHLDGRRKPREIVGNPRRTQEKGSGLKA
jgi:hypothetical protein